MGTFSTAVLKPAELRQKAADLVAALSVLRIRLLSKHFRLEL